MVNVYGDFSETGYRNPYYAPAPATRAEADYNNTAGRSNRANVGLGSNYGEATHYYEQQQSTQSQRQQQPVNEAPVVAVAPVSQGQGAAYDMATEAARRGDVIDPYVLQKAREQGFTGNIVPNQIAPGAANRLATTRNIANMRGNLYGTDATALTAMNATFVGKSTVPKFAPVEGSVTQRFAFDEYGKVLKGGAFEPAFNSTNIPYNTKMGSGDYVYIGEYKYGTGEVVSRYYERNVGSYVDFSEAGAMGRHEVIVRSGGSPGSYGETNLPKEQVLGGYYQTGDIGVIKQPAEQATPPKDRNIIENLNYGILGVMGIGAQGLEQPGTTAPTPASTAAQLAAEKRPFVSTAGVQPSESKGVIGSFFEGVDNLNKDISKKYLSFLPEINTTPEGLRTATRGALFIVPGGAALTENPLVGKQASEFIGGYAVGEYVGLKEKPVTSLTYLGIGAGAGIAFRGVSGVSKVAVDAAASEFPRTTKAFKIFTEKVVPFTMGGLFATDVAIRSTESGKNLEPSQVGQKAGAITSTEVIPLTVGFMGGYRSPEIIRGGYEYAKTGINTLPERYDAFKKSIPTRDQIYYKYVELKSPTTAMNQPMASERYITPRTPGTGSSSRFIESQRIAERGSGTRAWNERGGVSGRPTPRQESLRLNYNPTAPLTEIKTSFETPGNVGSRIGGIRGTLRGKWDQISTGTQDPFANLPLKERWKAREAAISSQGGYGASGIKYGGKPTGGLQSGVGEGGTTVRGGRQYLEIRMPSSGVSSQEGSLAPEPLEIFASRRTAQRSRAFDLEYEYTSRKLPEGTTRPSPRTGTESIEVQTPSIEEIQTPGLVQPQMSELQQKSKQGLIQAPFIDRIQISLPEQSPRQDTKQDNVPTLVPRLDLIQPPAQTPISGQTVVPRQDTTTVPIPTLTPPPVIVTNVPTINPPWRPITVINNPPPIPPEYPKNIPVEPPIIPPFVLPSFTGGGTGSLTRKRRRTYLEIFPWGLDISMYGRRTLPRRVGKGPTKPKKVQKKRSKK